MPPPAQTFVFAETMTSWWMRCRKDPPELRHVLNGRNEQKSARRVVLRMWLPQHSPGCGGGSSSSHPRPHRCRHRHPEVKVSSSTRCPQIQMQVRGLHPTLCKGTKVNVQLFIGPATGWQLQLQGSSDAGASSLPGTAVRVPSSQLCRMQPVTEDPQAESGRAPPQA